jgi:flavodoxin
MQTLVIYDSKFGNTEKVAEAIGRGAASLGAVRVRSTSEAAGSATFGADRPDLVILGGPTHNHGVSKVLRAFLDAIPVPLQGLPAAAFDTRYRGPSLVMGSAASGADKALRGNGSRAVASPESFFIVRGGPLEKQSLEPGELDRAEAWGRSVASAARGA